MTTTITIDDAGRVTIPEEARIALGIAEGGELDLKITSDNGWTTLVLRAHIPDDDAWLYTEENLEGIRKALDDVAAGRVYAVTMEQLKELAELANKAGG